MKNFFIIAFVILSCAFNSFAQSFEHIPLKQLIEESDVVLMGTLRSVSSYSIDNIEYSQGAIVIEEFISGNVETLEGSSLKMGDKIRLTWQNPSSKVNGRLELGGSENNQVIWILKVKNDGTVSSNYFWCYWSTGELQNVKNIIKETKSQKDLKKVELVEEKFSIINGKTQRTIISKNSQNDETKQNKKSSSYSDLVTLIMILISLNLYWILYRSRFKIR